MKNPALLEEIKTYKGRDEVPEDFDIFWDEEVKKVSTLPDYQLEERDFHIPQVKCYELTFEATNEGKVYARVVLPKSEGKVPICLLYTSVLFNVLTIQTFFMQVSRLSLRRLSKTLRLVTKKVSLSWLVQ